MSRRYELVYSDQHPDNALQVVDNGQHSLRFTNLKSCHAVFLIWQAIKDDTAADAFVDGLHAMYMLTAESFGAITIESINRTH